MKNQMSIAKMKKVTIIGTKDKQEQILKKIMKKGFLQIEDMSPILEDEEYKDYFRKDENNDEIGKISQKLLKIEKAISNVKKYNDVKKSMFSDKNIYKELSENIAESSYEDAQRVNELSDIIEKRCIEIKEFNDLIKELEPWINFSISTNLKNINYVKIILGTISLKYKKEQIELDLNKQKLDYSINVISKDKTKMYVAIATKNENLLQIKRILKQFNFEEKEIELQDETVEEKIQKIRITISNLEKEIETYKSEIKSEQLKVFENLDRKSVV